MDYEKAWNKLKIMVKNDLKYHESGKLQSMTESIYCTNKCKEFLGYMRDIEDENKKDTKTIIVVD